ncbi:hypothetical protein AAW12_24080 [Sphingobacterium sp. Ag1]|uniref:SMI1/KNR4 family protein n=1 Tax=Sphingobacterium sp. Ag1 TaxID=1643451 RepID=UPI000627A762|nr:SMI1/KNR4 family protein [Sphingobacterium sp. Ag1]KKO89205.1 hypothetical protein AAW12_24080 [Sphingobacterium sp. Ag1]
MEIIVECDKRLEELYKFSDSILYLGEPILDSRLENLESQIGFKLPEDFKYILKKHNKFSLAGTEVYGLSENYGGSSLDFVYNFEHFEAEQEMPKPFFPFSPDGQGNHYCLDLSKIKDGLCPVVFWQWDIEYEDLADVEECNTNFLDWIGEVMIEWTLEVYDYDGSEK